MFPTTQIQIIPKITWTKCCRSCLLLSHFNNAELENVSFVLVSDEMYTGLETRYFVKRICFFTDEWCIQVFSVIYSRKVIPSIRHVLASARLWDVLSPAIHEGRISCQNPEKGQPKGQNLGQRADWTWIMHTTDVEYLYKPGRTLPVPFLVAFRTLSELSHPKWLIVR